MHLGKTNTAFFPGVFEKIMFISINNQHLFVLLGLNDNNIHFSRSNKTIWSSLYTAGSRWVWSSLLGNMFKWLLVNYYLSFFSYILTATITLTLVKEIFNLSKPVERREDEKNIFLFKEVIYCHSRLECKTAYDFVESHQRRRNAGSEQAHLKITVLWMQESWLLCRESLL